MVLVRFLIISAEAPARNESGVACSYMPSRPPRRHGILQLPYNIDSRRLFKSRDLYGCGSPDALDN